MRKELRIQPHHDLRRDMKAVARGDIGAPMDAARASVESKAVLLQFDPAQGLTSDEAIAAFMAEAMASADAEYIAHASEVVARAIEMNQTTTKTAHS